MTILIQADDQGNVIEVATDCDDSASYDAALSGSTCQALVGRGKSIVPQSAFDFEPYYDDQGKLLPISEGDEGDSMTKMQTIGRRLALPVDLNENMRALARRIAIRALQETIEALDGPEPLPVVVHEVKGENGTLLLIESLHP